jgi:AAA+ superfamily predicted ATPase
MDVKELIKLQLLSKPDSGNSIKTIQYLVAASIIEEGIRHVGTIACAIRNRFRKKVSNVVTHKPLSKDGILLGTKHNFNRVSMKRDWKTTQESFQETNIMVDSVLNVISKLDNVPRLQLIENAHSLVNYREKPFQVTRDIFAKVENIVTDPETGVTVSVELSLVSNSLSSSEILKWVRQVYALYKEQIKNSLGDTLFFFDQKSKDSGGDPRGHPLGLDDQMKSAQKALKIATAPKQLGFVKSPFYSNKSFRNIFGKEVREVEERVKFFLENREWYDQRGIPYQLGLLLSGVPGSGKTSIIRAMANLTKRHIINVNFANITTATQLKNLFFNEKITVYTDSTLSHYDVLTIPIENRIFVLEEIDAIGNIVQQRVPGQQVDTVPDELTLAEILTVLDGTLEAPGRIVIMTSNHPEVLDEALIRPGRIDVSVKFGYASRELICEMYKCFFGKKFPFPEKLPDQKLTPAEVGQVLFRNFKDPSPEIVLEDFFRKVNETVRANPVVPDNIPVPQDSTVHEVIQEPDQDSTPVHKVIQEPMCVPGTFQSFFDQKDDFIDIEPMDCGGYAAF